MRSITSLADLQQAVNQANSIISNAAQAAQQALESTHDEHGDLLVPAGQVRRIHEKALAEFDAAAERVRAALEDWERQAHTYRLRAAGDPFAMLGGLELEKANALLPTVRLYCEVAPLPELAARLASVAAGDDLPLQLVYRLCAGTRAMQETPAPGPDATAQPTGDSGRREFQAALETLRAVAVPRQAAEAVELAEAITEAVGILRRDLTAKDPRSVQRKVEIAQRMRQDF